MGKQTIIRVKDRANVKAIIKRTTGLFCFAVFLMCVAYAYFRTPTWVFSSNKVITCTFKEVPNRITLKNHQGQASLPKPEVVAYKTSYDITDEVVLLELTGRIIKLADSPAAALKYSRQWDGPVELINVTSFTPDPADAPVLVRISRPSTGGRVTGGNRSGHGSAGSDGQGGGSGGSGTQDPPSKPGDPPVDQPPGEEPPVGEPEVVESGPSMPPGEEIPSDAAAIAKQAQTLLDEADAIYRTWQAKSDTDYRNATLRQAQEKFEQARDLLRPWCEKYPNNQSLTALITYALRGRFDCAKHRTR